MKLREATIEDINVETTFSPIREILLFDDVTWEKFENDNSDYALIALEALFCINEIFPDGVPGAFRYELGKFMATIDTFQVTLSFLSSLTDDENFKKILMNYRISIQNFQIYSFNKSYYSAFMEFRKMLEGILWMRFIIDNNYIPRKITLFEYKESLSKINTKFGDIYSRLNHLFHYSKNTPSFNMNILYQENDYLFEFLNMISSIADLYEGEINNFVDNFNQNKTINRYITLVKKVYSLREECGIMNYPITRSCDNTFEKGQNNFVELINNFNIYKMKSFKIQYEKGITEVSMIQRPIPEHKNLEVGFRYLRQQYSGLFEKYALTINVPNIHINSLQRRYIDEISRKNAIFKISSNILTSLLEKEIKDGGNRNLAFLRSVIEDICFNSAMGKSIAYSHTTIISEFFKKEYKLKIKGMERKYSHILRDGAPVYDTSKASDKTLEENDVVISEFIDFLNNVSALIKKI